MRKRKIIWSVIIIICIIVSVIGRFFLNTPKTNFDNDVKYITEVSSVDDISLENDGDINVIAYLTIDSIDLEKAPIAEGTKEEILNKYIGHFEETPYVNGNISLCAHNRGYEKNYFHNLKNVKNGDLVEYQTKENRSQYKISKINKISETDLSVLNQTEENKLTLITCVENEPQYRYCVIADKIE